MARAPGHLRRAKAKDVPLKLLQLLWVKVLVPAHVDKHLDAAIELQQGLRRGRRRLRAQQRREGKHGGGCVGQSSNARVRDPREAVKVGAWLRSGRNNSVLLASTMTWLGVSTWSGITSARSVPRPDRIGATWEVGGSHGLPPCTGYSNRIYGNTASFFVKRTFCNADSTGGSCT